jgi:small multidrug resistance family-3 protein
MSASGIAQSVGLFLIAGLCEIAGGWLIWQSIRESRPVVLGIVWGIVALPLRCDPYPSTLSLRSRLRGLWRILHCLVFPLGLDRRRRFARPLRCHRRHDKFDGSVDRHLLAQVRLALFHCLVRPQRRCYSEFYGCVLRG